MKKNLLLLSLLLIASLGSFAQWNAMATMTTARAQHAAVAHPNGKVYVFAGYDISNEMASLEIYTQSTNTWTTGAPVPVTTRAMSFALGLDSMIYCFSGETGSGVTGNCYKYNVNTNTWTAIANIPSPVWESSAATAVNGNIIVFGGEGSESLVQIYNPTLNTWSNGTPIPVPCMMPGVAAAANGKIYVIGGMDAGGNTVLGNVQIYDPILNSWTTGAAMTTPRNQFGCTYYNGRIYTIGGKTNYGNNNSPFYTTVEVYNVTANTWSTGTSLPQGIGECEAVSINAGINLFGGTNNAVLTTNYRMDINVSVKENELSQMSVFPNPSSGLVNITFNGAQDANSSISVCDVSGREVYSISNGALNGMNEFQLDLSELKAGIYFLRLNSQDAAQVCKLTITE